MKPAYRQKAITVIGIVYGFALLYVLFFRSFGRTYGLTYTEYLFAMHNFLPLKSVYILLTTSVISIRVLVIFAVNFVGNIVLFIPWGVLLPTCFNQLRSFKRFMAATLFALFLVETIQILTMLGIFDVEDILLNISGACIGYVCYKKCSKKRTNE